jgi:AAA domain
VGVLERVDVDEARLRDRRLVPDPWFLNVPAIAQLCRAGVDLDPQVTVIVGENGSGKSTFVEAWPGALVLEGEVPIPQGGCFLRAESMHGLFGDIDAGVKDHAGALLSILGVTSNW